MFPVTMVGKGNVCFGKSLFIFRRLLENMISDKETLLDDGIESYEKHAYGRIYALEYGLKILLETVILYVNEIPKFEAYIVVSELNGRSFLYKKKNDDSVDKIQFFIDNLSLFQSNGKALREISGILNLKEDELFIHPLYVKSKLEEYQIYLVIYTEDYSKYISLNYYYERFAFDSEGTFSLRKYSPVTVCDELASNAIRFIYSEFGYQNNKNIPQFSIITKLSAMTYENNKCNARIICTHEVKNLDIKFTKPVTLDAYNLRAIRKLLEIANNEMALIVRWKTREGDVFPVYEVLGFAKRKDYQQCIQFLILGYLHWRLIDEEKTILNYCKGRYIVNKEEEFDDKYLRQSLHRIFGNNAESDKIVKIVKEAWGQLHGTTLIITNDVQNEVLRLCSKNRGYQIDEIELDIQYKLVNSITAIDGAVMLDESGKCFGIGVILDGKCIVKGNQSRGARFNSAYNYVAIMSGNNKNAIAIVISEDRTVDIITSHDTFDEI